jgi:hypothetical protein
MGAGQSTGAAPAAMPDQARAEAAAEALQAGLSSTVDAAQMAAVIPLQKASLLCTLACFDLDSPAELHAW